MEQALLTPWGENLDSSNPLPDYPRPQMVRGNWKSLNGQWDYALTEFLSSTSTQAPSEADGGLADPTAVADPSAAPHQWDGKIVVPFSPEVPLSGVNRQVLPRESLWYHRNFFLPRPLYSGERVLLHFGAVDQSCRIAINGIEIGGHVGGFLPFSFDITDALVAGKKKESLQSVVVAVRDVSDTSWHSRGKQRLERGGIWYTAQSGIWQTVWLEIVPKVSIDRVEFMPDLENGVVRVQVCSTSAQSGQQATVKIFAEPTNAMASISGSGKKSVQAKVMIERSISPSGGTEIPLPGAKEWSPDTPYLYSAQVSLGRDKVNTYFAWRSFGVGTDQAGQPTLLLNGSPHLPIGLLDQGYWPDGGLTPPADAAMSFDISLAKNLGYNMLRKHIKVEPLRWYHHCDRLGMLVWQDAVNGGGTYKETFIKTRVLVPYQIADSTPATHRLLARDNPLGRRQYEIELVQMIDLLRGVPSISLWVPFNEGWGQFDAARICDKVRRLDPSRPIDHASGWFDQHAGDIRSVHLYFRPLTAVGRGLAQKDKRVLAITEYGGYSLPVRGHMATEHPVGYRKYSSRQKFIDAFVELHHKEVEPALRRGVRGLVYTQLSDVEDEVNGLTTYDRRLVKVPIKVAQQVNQALHEAAGIFQ